MKALEGPKGEEPAWPIRLREIASLLGPDQKAAAEFLLLKARLDEEAALEWKRTIAENRPDVLTRRCKECGEEKFFAALTWRSKRDGTPVGNVCLACHQLRVRKASAAARKRKR